MIWRRLQDSGIGEDYRIVVSGNYRIVGWWGLQDRGMEEITG